VENMVSSLILPANGRWDLIRHLEGETDKAFLNSKKDREKKIIINFSIKL
jgi:hypothetical protein